MLQFPLFNAIILDEPIWMVKNNGDEQWKDEP